MLLRSSCFWAAQGDFQSPFSTMKKTTPTPYFHCSILFPLKIIHKILFPSTFLIGFLTILSFSHWQCTFPGWVKVSALWLYVLIMWRTRFRVNPHSIVAWMSSNFLLEADVKSDCNWTRTHNHLVHKRTLNHLAKLAFKWLSVRL